MLKMGLHCIRGDSQDGVGAVHRPQKLCERNMKVAQCLMCGLLVLVGVLLREAGRMVRPMAQLVRQRNVLRSQQQNCQRNMQHSAFEGHWSLPLCSRLRKLKHKVNLRAKPSIRAALTSGKAYRWY